MITKTCHVNIISLLEDIAKTINQTDFDGSCFINEEIYAGKKFIESFIEFFLSLD